MVMVLLKRLSNKGADSAADSGSRWWFCPYQRLARVRRIPIPTKMMLLIALTTAFPQYREHLP